MKRSILLVVTGLFFVVAVTAQTAAWETKAVGKWDSTDVGTILTNSAWGKTINSGVLQDGPTFGTVKGAIAASYNLRSSLLVRYALIRQLQLEQRYDQMDEKGKIEFDKKNAALLKCPLCVDYYIVSIRGSVRELKDIGLIEQRRKQIFLSNEKGEKRYLAKFSPLTFDGSEALFFFPRKGEDGKVLLAPDNKKLTFNVVWPDIERDSAMSLIRNIEINVADIVREGIVVF